LSTTGLRKVITLRYAIAFYVSSVLGPSILVMPGLAAKIAGPGSIIAWIGLSLASFPFAYTFASLSARHPESGGVYSFSKEAFGYHTGVVVSWLFAFWFITGAPAVTLIAASYLGYAFPLTRAETFLAAVAIILTAFVVNFRGIVVSSKVQLAVIVSIVVVLVAATLSSLGQVHLSNFSPFLPDGILAVGTAASLIFWSYLGYENVSNVAEEFENPKRDFVRSIFLSVLLVGVLFVSVSFVTIGTGVYAVGGGGVAPFAAMLSNVIGRYAAVSIAILTAFIIFGVANAYMTGMSRVIYAASRDGALPSVLNKLDPKTRAPSRALLALFFSAMVALVIFYFLNVNLEDALLIPSGAAIIVYVIGSSAGIKLMRDNRTKTIFSGISLGISLIILPFVGVLLAASFGAILVALVYATFSKRGKNRVEVSR
jgi:amino acid efflux transporter